ncbi:MAG: hypothetical protein LBS86_02730 [Treponema sp.]|nr:hypothetical protein [Treponema sp.]
MFTSSLRNTIPEEYRKIAETLFPSDDVTPIYSPSVDAALNFAEILGIESDYKRLLDTGTANTEPLTQFLRHFQNNLDLLIQKTWVEDADDDQKATLQSAIPPFIAHIQREHYEDALNDFSFILEKLAYLFFGAQAHKDDFTEYTFRIDTQMGLFWWYGGQIGRLSPTHAPKLDAQTLRAMLLLGICYLTNF